VALTTQTRRVRALEGGGGGSRGFPPCPECGGPDDFGPDNTYELIFIDPGGPEDKEEFCETCGRQTRFVIRFPEDLS
jgi:hypothetical protein